jgi:solute:Na+ symporter, SSS family
MPDHIHLGGWDMLVFAAYMLLTVVLGFLVARGAVHKSTRGYFLGNNNLPWYVVGASMVSTDLSSEHFIANVGAGYRYGIVTATGSWNVWIIYSILILIFLPYYMRSGIYTMPQFLERRFNTACRYVFAISLVIGYVTAILAGSLYAGGVALESLFGFQVHWGIWLFALVTGAYTIYGGLASAAWTDFMQMIVLLAAGILVPILALHAVGHDGLASLIQQQPEKFQVFLPTTHPRFPLSGVFTGFLTVGLWYSCTSQHMVQRYLAAEDEWHGRMGVILAGYLHIITPFFFVVPGLLAYKLLPGLDRPDHAYLALVKALVPTGLKGLILAGLAAALMSTVSAVLNSTSTILTLDIYKKLIRPESTDRQNVLVGRITTTLALLASVGVAFYFASQKSETLFVLVQNIFFYIAPPFAVVFLTGLLWKRANAQGAMATIVLGFAFTWLLDKVLFKKVPFLIPFGQAYQHRAIIAWGFCMSVMIVVSLLTSPPRPDQVEGIIWSWKIARMPEELRRKYHGWKDYRIWWFGFVAVILGIYAFFLWFRFQHPVKMLP